MIWGKHRENMIRIMPKRLRKKNRPRKILWRGHDAFYFKGKIVEVRIMKFWMTAKGGAA